MPLTVLNCDYNEWRDRQFVRGIKTLKTINEKPAADFWKIEDQEKFRFDTWVARVGFMKPEEQVKEVAAELMRKNPGFDGKVDHQVHEGAVVQFSFTGDKVGDLVPLRPLSALKRLYIYGMGNPFFDLSPLKGMRLTELCIQNSRVVDLSPLKSMPLTRVECFGCPIGDLSSLQGMPLTYLLCHHTSIADLSPLKGMPIAQLHIGATKVTDLSPLRGMPLKILVCDLDPKRDAEILRSIKTLETINGKPPTETLK